MNAAAPNGKAKWIEERIEIERELRALWEAFAVQYDDDSGGIDWSAEFPPYPEGVPLAEVLRMFAEFL